MPGHGNIILDISTQTLNHYNCTNCGAELNREYVVLSTRDNGAGLSLESLTEEFKQIVRYPLIQVLPMQNQITNDCNGHIILPGQELDNSYNNHGTSIQQVFNISLR